MSGLAGLLDDLATPGVDSQVVTDYVMGSVRFRRRMRGIAAVGVGMALLAGGTALAMSGASDPEEVVSESTTTTTDTTKPTTSTTAPSTTGAPTTVPTTAPVATVPTTATPTTAAATPRPAPAPAAPGPVATTTTLPPDRAPTVTLEVLTPEVPAGGIARVRVQWSDPDLPEGEEPLTAVGFSGTTFTQPSVPDTAGTACTGGSARSGATEWSMRLTAPGEQTVAARVAVCGHIVNAFAEVRVTGAVWAGGAPGSGRALVVRSVSSAGATVPSPESLRISWVDGAGVHVVQEPPAPPATGLALTHGPEPVAPATAVVVPTGAAGTIRMQSGTTCWEAAVSATAASVDLTGPGTAC